MLAKTMIAVCATVAVTAASTVPAMSKSSKHRPHRPAAAAVYAIPPAPAYGVRTDGRAHSSNPAHDVYVDGLYAGSDPDPRIRASLAFDPPWRSFFSR
jgi:hypothetical protein